MTDLATITGQKPVVCRAKKSVANFKLREGMPIGVKVTLRNERMYEFLDKFFNEIHYDVREGEDTLTDIWFEKEARDAARERGIEITPESLDRLIDEAWETKKPPFEIDFRQSYSRKNRYRV
jgi:hypothetical protein